MKKAEKRNVLKDETGFTLIEIIAVLIILGILAAVAIPKYSDLQEEATIKGAQGIVAGAASQLSLSYAEAILKGTDLTTTSGATECAKVAITGEYTLTCGATPLNGDVIITVSHPGMTADQTETWKSPSGA